jgi:hypothetical protein
MDPLPSFPPHLGASLAPTPVVPPLTLAPLARPPAAAPPPQPSRPPLSPPPGYTRSIHACPAAYPRMYEGTLSRASYPYSPIPPNETKEARMARLEKDKVACAEEARAASKTEGAGWESNGGEGLWVSVERWRRDSPVEGGITLLMLHANGMLKEVSRCQGCPDGRTTTRSCARCLRRRRLSSLGRARPSRRPLSLLTRSSSSRTHCTGPRSI